MLTVMLLALGCSEQPSWSAPGRQQRSAATAAAQPTSARAQSTGDTFYGLLGLTRYDYTPLSAEELVERSELIVRGTMVSVADGERIRRRRAKVHPDTFTLVVEVDVGDVLKGPSTHRIYVEFIHGGAVPTEVYAEHIPSGEVTFFLMERKERQSTESHEIVDKGRGHPKGTPSVRTDDPPGIGGLQSRRGVSAPRAGRVAGCLRHRRQGGRCRAQHELGRGRQGQRHDVGLRRSHPRRFRRSERRQRNTDDRGDAMRLQAIVRSSACSADRPRLRGRGGPGFRLLAGAFVALWLTSACRSGDGTGAAQPESGAGGDSVSGTSGGPAGGTSEGGAGSAYASGMEGAQLTVDAFYDAFSAANADYVVHSGAEVVERSELIVLARMIGIDQGVLVRRVNVPIPSEMQTYVFEFGVDRTLKGAAKDRVYVAAAPSGDPYPLAGYKDSLPEQEVALFLVPREENQEPDSPQLELVGVGSGHPEGTPLYQLANPQCLVIEGSNGLRQPLESPENPLFDESITKLDELAAKVEMLVAE